VARTVGKVRGASVLRYLRYPWALVPALEPAAALRLSCYLGGLACVGGITGLHNNLWAVGYYGAAIAFVLLALAFVLFFLAARATVPRSLQALLPGARPLLALGLAVSLGISCYSLVSVARLPQSLSDPTRYWNDAVAITDCSAQLFARGRNPYTAFDEGTCLAGLHMDGRFTTPLRAGAFAGYATIPSRSERVRLFAQDVRQGMRRLPEFESLFSYPAGAFIFTWPVIALGGNGLSIFYIACFLLCYALLAWRAPARVRPWLALIALAHVGLWSYAAHGYSEGLDILLILAAWVFWRRALLSSVLLGLAVATRQDAWLVVPYYAILVGATYGVPALLRRLAVLALFFAAANAPFIVLSPRDWLDGILGPLKDPMFPGGDGLIGLSTSAWLPLWPRPVYTVLEAGAFVVCCAVYAHICRRHPGTGLVLALAPLFFAWRSLSIYFVLPLPIYVLWPVLADLAASVSAARPQGSRDGETTGPARDGGAAESSQDGEGGETRVALAHPSSVVRGA